MGDPETLIKQIKRSCKVCHLKIKTMSPYMKYQLNNNLYMCLYEYSKLNNFPFLAALHYLRINRATNLLLVSQLASPFPLARGTYQLAKSRCSQALYQVQYGKLLFTHRGLMTDVYIVIPYDCNKRSVQPKDVSKLRRFQH